MPIPARLALFATLLLMPTLQGCGMINDAILFPQVERANARMASAKVDCDLRYPPQIGGYLAHARCVDGAQNLIVRPFMPYPDLLARNQSTREILAARVDRGELDPADYARLVLPEDEPLTVDASTRRGPLSRTVGGVTYPPAVIPQSNRCNPSYGFSGC